MKKDRLIRIRVGENMFSYICKMAREENKTASQVIRRLIEENMKKEKKFK